MSLCRILLADDHVLIQEGLRRMLEPQHDVVDAVSDGRSLVDAALRLKPELIILDVSMPLLGGIDAARQIRKRLPRTKLLFLTVHANPAYLREALGAGATGYILKSATRQEILDAVKAVLAGQRYISRGHRRGRLRSVEMAAGKGRRSSSDLDLTRKRSPQNARGRPHGEGSCGRLECIAQNSRVPQK